MVKNPSEIIIEGGNITKNISPTVINIINIQALIFVHFFKRCI